MRVLLVVVVVLVSSLQQYSQNIPPLAPTMQIMLQQQNQSTKKHTTQNTTKKIRKKGEKKGEKKPAIHQTRNRGNNNRTNKSRLFCTNFQSVRDTRRRREKLWWKGEEEEAAAANATRNTKQILCERERDLHLVDSTVQVGLSRRQSHLRRPDSAPKSAMLFLIKNPFVKSSHVLFYFLPVSSASSFSSSSSLSSETLNLKNRTWYVFFVLG